MIKTIEIGDIIEVFSPKHKCYRQVQIKAYPMNPGEPWVLQDVQDQETFSLLLQGGVFIKQQNVQS
jgi:hypothetical protein